MGDPVPLPTTTPPPPLLNSSLCCGQPVPPTAPCRSSPCYPHALRPTRSQHSRVEPYSHQPPASSPAARGRLRCQQLSSCSVRCCFHFLSDTSCIRPLRRRHPPAPFLRTYQSHVCMLALPAYSFPRPVPLASRGLDGRNSGAAHPFTHPSPQHPHSRRPRRTDASLAHLPGPGPP
jgi:hypothetical protein